MRENTHTLTIMTLAGNHACAIRETRNSICASVKYFILEKHGMLCVGVIALRIHFTTSNSLKLIELSNIL